MINFCLIGHKIVHYWVDIHFAIYFWSCGCMFEFAPVIKLNWSGSNVLITLFLSDFCGIFILKHLRKKKWFFSFLFFSFFKESMTEIKWFGFDWILQVSNIFGNFTHWNLIYRIIVNCKSSSLPKWNQ